MIYCDILSPIFIVSSFKDFSSIKVNYARNELLSFQSYTKY